MKERLGGKPPSAAKTWAWAVLGKKRLQEIRNLSPKGKGETNCQVSWVFNHSRGKRERRGHIPEEGRPVNFSPSTCCSPLGSPARQSRVQKVEGGRGQSRGRSREAAGCVRTAGRLCPPAALLRGAAELPRLPAPGSSGHPRAQTPRGARTGRGSHPGGFSCGITCKRAPQSCTPGPQGVAAAPLRAPRQHPGVAVLLRGTSGVPSDPLSPRAAAAPPAHLIGPGGRGGAGGGAGRSGRPQQRRAAARVPTGSRRAPAEAMHATLPGPGL